LQIFRRSGKIAGMNEKEPKFKVLTEHPVEYKGKKYPDTIAAKAAALIDLAPELAANVADLIACNAADFIAVLSWQPDGEQPAKPARKKRGPNPNWAEADWTKTNRALADWFTVTVETVERQRRKAANLAKAAQGLSAKGAA
jgi:hypothetical protein